MSEELINLADRFEPRIRDSILSAIAELKDAVIIDELEQRILSQGVTGALVYLEELQVEGRISQFVVNDLQESINDSGRITFGLIPDASKTGLIFNFSILNPATAQFYNEYEFNLIRQISDNTKEAIRQTLRADFAAGVNPRQSAQNFKATLGLTPRQEQIVRNYEQGLRSLDNNVLRRSLVSARTKDQIQRAIANNQPLTEQQIQRLVNDYRSRWVRHRAETIARTEALRAVHLGNYTSGLQAITDGTVERESVKRFWVFVNDPRTRDAHKQVPGLNPEGVFLDQPFQTPLGPLRFPQDPSGSAANTIDCRCSVIYRLV